MTRIKITDLPQDIQISPTEMKKVFGGIIIVDGRVSPINTGLDSRQLKIDNALGSTLDSTNRMIEEDPWHT